MPTNVENLRKIRESGLRVPLVHGALIEYHSGFMGESPNVVMFQFNPESLARTISIPVRPSGLNAREAGQAGDAPTEKITLSLHFNAADQLNFPEPLAKSAGVGPQLAALEMMVTPLKIKPLKPKTLTPEAKAATTVPIPRENYPRILFAWGHSRILPVIIESMTITEQQFDPMLNPVQAEVAIGLAVTLDPCAQDLVAEGSLNFTNNHKVRLAYSNQSNSGLDIMKMGFL